MNIFSTTLISASIPLILTACKTSEKLQAESSQSITKEVEITVEQDGTDMRVMVNGEEQAAMGELLYMVDVEDTAGAEMYYIVNGEEVEALPEGMMDYVMQMMAEGADTDVDISVSYDWDGPPTGMRDHMMQRMRGGDGGGHEGGHHMYENDISEEIQFMEELGMLQEVSQYLEQNTSVALMGIHMIRDELEGEVRLEALESIIDESGDGSAVRNAALFVAIQTLQEDGDDEGAAEYMVELVLSN